MYEVITLATSKGGAGKSTLARSLAAHWLSVGHRPALIDADPQRSIAARHDPNGKMAEIPVIAEPEERVYDAIQELRGKNVPVIVDTAGFRNRTTLAALVASDLAIIPLKASAEDVDGAIATYELIQELNATPERKHKPIKAVMIMTMTLSTTVISRHVRSQLQYANYPLLKSEMLNRVSYPEAGITGLAPTISDPDGAAARDISAIAKEIMNSFMNENSGE